MSDRRELWIAKRSAGILPAFWCFMLHFSMALALALTISCAAPQTADQPKSDASGREVTIVPAEEPGERMAFGGRVLDYAGRPLSSAAVVAYNADRDGLYNPRNSQTRVPRLRGVAVTNERGEFRFVTVRPGPYPDGSEPAHIHLIVAAPAHDVKHVAYWFEGDPLITPERRRAVATQGETVIVRPARQPSGVWTFTHDIRLEGN